MYIPRSVLLGLLVAAAGVLGWMLNGLTSESDPVADATPTAATGLAEPDPGDAADGDASGDTIVNVIVPPEGGTAATPAVVLTTTSGTAGGSAAPGADRVATASDARPEHGRAGARAERADRARPGAGEGAITHSRAGSRAREATPQPTRSGSGGVSLSLGGDQMGAGASDFAVSAAGHHIVIAYDDSIVFIGDDGRLTANTGDASSSGTVALDVAGSDLASGDSRTTPASPATTSSARVASSGSGGATQWTTGTLDLSQAPGRGVAISGYEDHSISVVGTDNVATYDDSNVFISRDGQINANTGDTDSSGLNVVDAVGSVVRSGDHSDGDDGSDDVDDEPEDTEEPEEAEEAEEADAATTPASAPVPTAATSTSPSPAPGNPAARSTGMVADEGDTSASGDSTVVIGADGYDDLALDVAGHGNVATYDDSNAVIGGAGDVNAQIGDSDTGGAVVMGVEGSVIEAGRSN